jgi:4-hydroxybenzoate polyprenyltransferase
MAGVVGGAVAAHGGWPGPAWRLPLAVLAALLLTGYSNGVNQIADLETDRINRPSRPLPAGDLSMRRAILLTVLLGLASMAAAWPVGPSFFLCCLATLPVTTAYSLPPLRWKRFPFGANAAIAGPRGLLVVVAGWAAGGGAARRDAWMLGVLAFAYIFGASVTKDFADVEGDRATGCVTLPILWGPARAARYVAPFLVVPFVLPPGLFAAGLLGGSLLRWSLYAAVLSLMGARAAWLLLRNPLPPADGSPHPAWLLMYLQYAASHLLAAAVYAL